MQFYSHPNLIGKHSFLSPSQYHWLNYDEEKLESRFRNLMAAQRGTELHEFAATCIRLGQKLTNSKNTINMYVNDAIGYRMSPEVPLYFSENAFGTADSIVFKNDFLRIHDLKTGDTPASKYQLMIYEALFCLEYKVKHENIKSELRIYQLNEKLIFKPEPEEIREIMDKIITFDKIITKLRAEVI